MYIFNFNWISESFKKHSHGVHELPVKQFHSFLTWIGRIFFIVISDYGSIIIAMEMKRSLGWAGKSGTPCSVASCTCSPYSTWAHSSQSVGIRNSRTTVVMLRSWAYADSKRQVYYPETWAWATVQPVKAISPSGKRYQPHSIPYKRWWISVAKHHESTRLTKP